MAAAPVVPNRGPAGDEDPGYGVVRFARVLDTRVLESDRADSGNLIKTINIVRIDPYGIHVRPIGRDALALIAENAQCQRLQFFGFGPLDEGQHLFENRHAHNIDRLLPEMMASVAPAIQRHDAPAPAN